jgi:excisionase family DNA binding protein
MAMTATTHDRLLRPKRVRELLGIGGTTFRLYVRSGKLPAVQLSRGAVRVPESAVLALIERCRIVPKVATARFRGDSEAPV